LVGLRSPVYFAAGVLRVNYLRFLITDICCALMVVTLFFGLTYMYGKEIWHWIHNAEVGLTVAVVVAIAAGLLIYFYWVHRREKAMLQHTADGENSVATASEPKTEVGSQKE
jgi:membrane protein DedA with SNARE-associated domain